jgi:serine beta-lactamase-like protein LACTB, mitochondrial
MRLALVIILSFTTFASFSQKIKRSALKKVNRIAEDSVKRYIEKSKVPGLAITVSVNEKIVWSQGFGLADIEQHVPVDASKTKFRIGSISKSLTAAALARIYEKNQIILDSSIYYYLPDYPVHQYRPTIRQLGGHLAGVRHYRGLEFNITKHYKKVQDALSIFKNDSLLHPPGSKYHYSSHGFNLLSAVMEKASRKPFLRLMEDEVFSPLRLQNTFPDQTDSLIDYRTRFYAIRDNRVKHAPYVDNSYKWAGGGFISTSEDITRFAHALLKDDYLKPETIVTFTTPQQLSDGSPTNYGIGFFSGKDSKGKSYTGHGGGSVGGTSDLVVYPKEKVVVVILTNLSDAKLGNLAKHIGQLYIGKLENRK